MFLQKKFTSICQKPPLASLDLAKVHLFLIVERTTFKNRGLLKETVAQTLYSPTQNVYFYLLFLLFAPIIFSYNFLLFFFLGTWEEGVVREGIKCLSGPVTNQL